MGARDCVHIDIWKSWIDQLLGLLAVCLLFHLEFPVNQGRLGRVLLVNKWNREG
jgi:hypothetical protein